MTVAEILANLAIEDCAGYVADNGGYVFLTCRRVIDGHTYSHSTRIPADPTDQDIERARQAFAMWWAEETKNSG